MTLPEGCMIRNLNTHADARGELTEIFREEWRVGIDPVQWNFVASRANVLRGVHVHARHTDYLVCLQGTLILGLVDIRPESPSHGLAATVELAGADMRGALIPPGVAHGFYFPEPSTFCYSVSHYWNNDDEIGCRWDDPTLGLDWLPQDPEISERDRSAGSAIDMTAQYLAACDARRSTHG